MRKAALLGAAAAIALGVSAAKADVYVNGHVDKHVAITIDELVKIQKQIDLKVLVDVDAKMAAKANTVVNQLNTNIDPTDCPTCGRPIDVGLAQISAGMAWWYRRYELEQSPKERNLYEATETTARDNGRGLWADSKPVAPWEWRRER